MAGQSTEVTTGKLTQAANTLTDLIGRYIAAVDRLYNCGAELDTMWEGEASRKFMFTLANDRERFNALRDILQRYVEVLNADASAYAQAESEVMNVLSAHAIRR